MPDTTNEQSIEAIPTVTVQGPEQQYGDEGISLMDLLAILARRKRLIGCSALIGGVLAAVSALLMPDVYTATAVVMPPQKEQSAATALMGQLGPLAAAAGTDMGLKSPSDLYVGFLGSRTIADRLIEQFQLRNLYRAKTVAATRARLKRHSHISAGRDTLIKIEVEDTDPSRAAALANSYVAELNRLNKRLAMTDAGQRRRFLEGELSQERTALADAEEAMKKQQMQSGIIQPDAQTSVAIGSVAQLRAQVAAGEVAIERLKIGATPQNPDFLRAQSEVEAMRAQLRKLESGSQAGDPLPSPSKMPESGLEYLRRLRDLKYHELLAELLAKQYEAARLDESKAVPDLPIVDRAVPPDRKSGPRRGLITLLGTLGASALAAAIAYFQSTRPLP